MIQIMKVVKKKDKVVHGLLEDELKRCENMAASLRDAIEALPKGSLHQRRMDYKGKISVYKYLKYRENGKSVYQHIRRADEAVIEKKVSERQRKEESLKSFRERIQYLHKLMRA